MSHAYSSLLPSFSQFNKCLLAVFARLSSALGPEDAESRSALNALLSAASGSMSQQVSKMQ